MSATKTTVPLQTIHNDPTYATEYSNFLRSVTSLLVDEERRNGICQEFTDTLSFVQTLDTLPALSIKQKFINRFLLGNGLISRLLQQRYAYKGKKICGGMPSYPMATVRLKEDLVTKIPLPLQPICDAIRMTKKF